MVTINEENFIQISHIMWQPIFKCKATCKGCYVRESESSKYNGPLRADILDYIFKDKKVDCEQLTISLDTLYSFSDVQDLVQKLKDLWKLYREGEKTVFGGEKSFSKEDRYLPELCVTVQNMNALTLWLQQLEMSLEQFMYPLTVLSLSQLPVQGKVCLPLVEEAEKNNVILNYNKVVTEKTASQKGFEMGVRYAHRTYLALHKNPLGEEQNPDAPQYIEDAIQAADEQHRNKITVDVCITDALIKTRKEEHACSAGISKVHVWPDGSVTGCPYDSHHIMGEKLPDTFQELRQVVAANAHPFKKCRISLAKLI